MNTGGRPSNGNGSLCFLCSMIDGSSRPRGHEGRHGAIDIDALVTVHRRGQHLPPDGPLERECPECIRVLRLARANHASHSGYPDPYPGAIEVRPGWWVMSHNDEECVRVYRFVAARMSAS